MTTASPHNRAKIRQKERRGEMPSKLALCGAAFIMAAFVRRGG
jgi:hypothetical protein